RPLASRRRFFMDRHARRAVKEIHLQYSARLLGKSRLGTERGGQQRARRREPIKNSLHSHLSPSALRAPRLPILASLSFVKAGASLALPPPPSCERLVGEPEVLEARSVVDAVDHQGQPLDPRLPARRLPRIEDDRPDIVLGQLAFDLPHQLSALLAV